MDAAARLLEIRWVFEPARLGNPSLSLLTERRGIALPRSLWLSSTKIGTLEVQRVLPKRSRGPREALVWGWPTPIRWKARTELPPLPRKPVYGPAAREEARRLMREAKREGINFGWSTKVSLCKVAKGECPLGYSVWHGAQAYVRRVQMQREHERDVRERPMQFRVVPGRGPLIGWRSALDRSRSETVPPHRKV